MGSRRKLAGTRRYAAPAIAVVLGLAAAAANAGPQPQPITFDIAYGSDPKQKLDVCRPAAPHPPARGVLLIHGGGWIAGDKAEFLGFCALAAQHGMVGIPVNYRLMAGPTGPTWPAPLQDVQLAVRWVRAHAAELGVDPERVCAVGNSAGGQLAVFLAALAAIAPGDQADQLPAVSPRVACAIDVSGPVDLARWPFSPQFAPRLFGELAGPALAEAEQGASPLARVTAATAPVMVIQGAADPLVPAEQARLLAAALRAHGVPAWLIEHPGGHGFQGLPPPQVTALLQLELAFLAAPPAAPKPN